MFPFTLHQLRILKTLALKQSFTDAATYLYTSQPSLSRQILVLENNLNVRLVNRQTSRISLTKDGNLLLKYSERILALCEESCRVLKDRKKCNPRKLDIGTNTYFGRYLLPRLLKLCHYRYPQLTLTVTVGSTEKISKRILNHKLDMVLASEEIYNFLKKDCTLKAEHYTTDPFHLILSNSHPLSKQVNIDKTDLYNLNYITLISDSVHAGHITNLLNLNRIKIHNFKSIIQLDSLDHIKTSVKLGLGIAFIPSLALKENFDLKQFKIIKVSKGRITQKVFIISPLKYLDSKPFKIVYNALLQLKKTMLEQE